jgi:hypothetical protein
VEDKNTSESQYVFTLILDSPTDLTDAQADALFEAGCDDATLGRFQGRVQLTFTRPGTSPEDAVASALADVERAKIGAIIQQIDIVTP